MPAHHHDASLQVFSFLCGIALLGGQSRAAETVTAELIDHRQVTGIVDARTDVALLWLRRDADGVELVSGFAWDQVARGKVDGRGISRSDLRTWALERKQPGRTFFELTPYPLDRPQPSGTECVAPAAIGSVKTLVIEAHIAQWDSDAQSDGLRVYVSPLDAQGHLVPVNGQIEFTLVGEMEMLNGSPRSSTRPVFQELERSSQLVRRQDFGLGSGDLHPAVYTVSFSQQHPDFQLNIAHQALLHARLGVPGRGVFEASDAQVMLRECSRFRDQLQYYSPARYLPQESGGGAGR